MNAKEAVAVNTVLRWAMAAGTGRRARTDDGIEITDDMATDAAQFLAGQARQPLMSGLGPDDVDLRADHGLAGRVRAVLEGTGYRDLTIRTAGTTILVTPPDNGPDPATFGPLVTGYMARLNEIGLETEIIDGTLHVSQS